MIKFNWELLALIWLVINRCLPCEKVPAVLGPMILQYLFDALLANGQNRQPSQYSPDAVLFSNVIRTSSIHSENSSFRKKRNQSFRKLPETLFTAQR